MAKDKIVINLDKIMMDPIVQANFAEIDDNLKFFLIETYSPILDKIEELYRENPLLDQTDERIILIRNEIYEQLQKLEYNNLFSCSDIETALGNSTSSLPTHLAFALQGIDNNKNLRDIIEGYNYKEKLRMGLSDRIGGQFAKDFLRIETKIVDQNNEIIDKDFAQTINLALKDKELNNTNLIEAIRKYINVSDEQAQFMISRFNQRSIQSSGTTFQSELQGITQKTKSAVFIVENIAGHKLNLQAINVESVTQRVLLNEDMDIIGGPFDFSKTSYSVNLRSLQNTNVRETNILALPSQNVPEVIAYEAMDEEARYLLPKYLRHRDIEQYQQKPFEEINIDDNYLKLPIDSSPIEKSPSSTETETQLTPFHSKAKLSRQISHAGSFLNLTAQSIDSALNFLRKGAGALSEEVLTPSKLNSNLLKNLEDLEFKNLKDSCIIKTESFEEDKEPRDSKSSDIELIEDKEITTFSAESFLYKENDRSVMFIAKSCSDASPKNQTKFQRSGGRNIESALMEVTQSEEYKNAKEQEKKIEIFVPFAITERQGLVTRNHWVTIHMREQNERMNLEIIDSMSVPISEALPAQNYDYTPTVESIQQFFIPDSNGTHEDEGFEIISTPLEVKFSGIEYRGDQATLDGTSCGHYVIKYITEHAEVEYRDKTAMTLVESHRIAAASYIPTGSGARKSGGGRRI